MTRDMGTDGNSGTGGWERAGRQRTDGDKQTQLGVENSRAQVCLLRLLGGRKRGRKEKGCRHKCGQLRMGDMGMAGDSRGKQIHCEYFRIGLRPYSPHTDLGFKPHGLRQKEQGCKDSQEGGCPQPYPLQGQHHPQPGTGIIHLQFYCQGHCCHSPRKRCSPKLPRVLPNHQQGHSCPCTGAEVFPHTASAGLTLSPALRRWKGCPNCWWDLNVLSFVSL